MGFGVRSLLVLWFALGVFARPALAETAAGLAGTWTGTYDCAATAPYQVELTLSQDAETRVSGVFAFDALGAKGSYTVDGRLGQNGRFRLVPNTWIDRPVGFAAAVIEGRLNPNGLLIEGTVQGCGAGGFKATRAGGVAAAGLAAPADARPYVPGPLAGMWQGAIGCSANRRGKTEHYPLTLQIFHDGDGVAAIAYLKVYKQRGSGAGDAFDISLVLSGQTGPDGATLGRPVVIGNGGTRVVPKALTFAVDAAGNLAGSVQMNGCDTLALDRMAAPAPVPMPAGLSGKWIGGQDTVLSVQVMDDPAQPMVEIAATYPADRPLAERDRLRVLLAPVAVQGAQVLLVPVRYREATGVFALDASPARHQLTDSPAALLAHDPASGAALFQGLSGSADLAALASPGRASPGLERRRYPLTRPAAAVREAFAAGGTPPVDLGPGIAGLVAAAPSREAQCAVMSDWLSPFAGEADVDRMSVDVVRTRIAAAFSDPVFEPVFGAPFLLTTDEERVALARLIEGSCHVAGASTLLEFVGSFVLRTPNGAGEMSQVIADSDEARLWLEAAEAGVAALPDDKAGLDQLRLLQDGLRQRRNDLLPSATERLSGVLDARRIDIETAILMAKAVALPETGFETGALDGALAMTRRVLDSGLPDTSRSPVAEVLRAKTTAILGPELAKAAAVAPGLPDTLDGLAQGRAAMLRFEAYRKPMEALFGTLDPDGVLDPLHARLDAIGERPEVRAALADRLAALDVTDSPDPVATVQAEAALFVDPLDTRYGDLVADAAEAAEVRALVLVDRSAAQDAGEPTVQEIATFALNRTRQATAMLMAQDQACTSGQIADAIQALNCLTSTGLWTGQGPMTVRLRGVTKLGCLTEAAGRQYLCQFVQDVRMNIPGGQSPGWQQMLDNAAGLATNEVLDARFIRAADGWSVITGDLKQ